MALRLALRRGVPLPLRRAVARLRRVVRDRLDGSHFRLARRLAPPWDSARLVMIQQPIRQSPLWEGKLANLQRGAGVCDRPGDPGGRAHR